MITCLLLLLHYPNRGKTLGIQGQSLLWQLLLWSRQCRTLGMRLVLYQYRIHQAVELFCPPHHHHHHYHHHYHYYHHHHNNNNGRERETC